MKKTEKITIIEEFPDGKKKITTIKKESDFPEHFADSFGQIPVNLEMVKQNVEQRRAEIMSRLNRAKSPFFYEMGGDQYMCRIEEDKLVVLDNDGNEYCVLKYESETQKPKKRKTKKKKQDEK